MKTTLDPHCAYCAQEAVYRCESCPALICDEHAVVEEYRPHCLKCAGVEDDHGDA